MQEKMKQKNPNQTLPKQILLGIKGRKGHDQVDFVLKIQGWFHVRKSLNVMGHASRLIEGKTMKIDTENLIKSNVYF